MKLETKRLILRAWSKNDIGDLIDGLNNLNVSRWLASVPYPYAIKDAEGWIQFCANNDRKGPDSRSYHFAIELKSEKKVIGGTGLEE